MNENMEQKYGYAGKDRYENWMSMLESIRREQSYKSDQDIQSSIQRLIQTVQDDRQRAFNKINFLEKVKMIGIILMVIFLVGGFILYEIKSFPVWWGVVFFAGLILTIIGAKSQNSPIGICAAAKDFEDQYLK